MDDERETPPVELPDEGSQEGSLHEASGDESPEEDGEIEAAPRQRTFRACMLNARHLFSNRLSPSDGSSNWWGAVSCLRTSRGPRPCGVRAYCHCRIPSHAASASPQPAGTRRPEGTSRVRGAQPERCQEVEHLSYRAVVLALESYASAYACLCSCVLGPVAQLDSLHGTWWNLSLMPLIVTPSQVALTSVNIQIDELDVDGSAREETWDPDLLRSLVDFNTHILRTLVSTGGIQNTPNLALPYNFLYTPPPRTS